MALFLQSLTSHHVKIIVSSRPLNECLATLYDSPTLRLQDLTRNDMATFVQGEFLGHHLMVRLMKQFPSKAPRIAEEVVEKAEGVFLWVILVVRLLLQGLENGDNLDELQAILTSLPPDLRALYKSMIGKMRIEHQMQASVMFQIMQEWNAKAHDRQLPVYVLSGALDPPSAIIDIPVEHIKYGDFEWTLTSLGNRIRSRCCGLLEVRHRVRAAETSRDTRFTNHEISRSVVTYLHRTVSEFLTAPEVRQDVCSLTNGTPFDPATSLTSACLIMLKAGVYWDELRSDSYLMMATIFLRDCKKITADLKLLFITQMDMTMSELERRYLETSDHLSGPVSHWTSTAFTVMDELLSQRLLHSHSVYVFLAYHGISYPMVSTWSGDDHTIQRDIIFGALESWLREHCSIEEKQEALSSFLMNVSSEGEEIVQEILRDHGLRICNELLKNGKQIASGSLLKTMLSAAKSTAFLFDADAKGQHISMAWALTLQSLGPQCDDIRYKRSPACCGDSLWADIQQLVSKAEAERNGASKSLQQARKSQKHRKKSRRARKEERRAQHGNPRPGESPMSLLARKS